MELDFSQKLQAGRPGPKSAAQTPAKRRREKKRLIRERAWLCSWRDYF